MPDLTGTRSPSARDQGRGEGVRHPHRAQEVKVRLALQIREFVKAAGGRGGCTERRSVVQVLRDPRCKARRQGRHLGATVVVEYAHRAVRGDPDRVTRAVVSDLQAVDDLAEVAAGALGQLHAVLAADHRVVLGVHGNADKASAPARDEVGVVRIRSESQRSQGRSELGGRDRGADAVDGDRAVDASDEVGVEGHGVEATPDARAEAATVASPHGVPRRARRLRDRDAVEGAALLLGGQRRGRVPGRLGRLARRDRSEQRGSVGAGRAGLGRRAARAGARPAARALRAHRRGAGGRR